MSDTYNLTEMLMFTGYNNTEKVTFHIDPSFNGNDTDGLYVHNNISSPNTINITSTIIGPSSMENSIVWTIICDLIGAPCVVAFLYVLYFGVEVLLIR